MYNVGFVNITYGMGKFKDWEMTDMFLVMGLSINSIIKDRK